MSVQLRLDLLETEVVTSILEYVVDTSPHTLKAVRLTSKFFYQITRLIVHRHSELSIDGEHDLENLPVKVERFLQDDKFLVQARTLTVKGSLDCYPRLQALLDDICLWEPMVKLISRIGRLQRLTWNLPSIPSTVLEALHTHQPSANLRLFNFSPSPEPFPSTTDKALAKSTALTHLRCTLRLPVSYSLDLQDAAVQRIIARTPLEYAGVVRRSVQTQHPDSETKVLYEKFLTHRKPNSTLKSLTLDGYEVSEKTLKEWSSVIDLTGLENVKFSRGLPTLGYFENAASMLPNLRHVSLNLARVQRSDPALLTAVQNYLRCCPALQSLSLWSWIDIIDLDDILKQHASSLRSLHLHEREDPNPRCPRKLLTPSQLQNIVVSCKKLKEFTFDLNRSSRCLKWAEDKINFPYFKILAGARLDYLQIYFDVGLAFIVKRYWTPLVGISADESESLAEESHEDEDETGEEEEEDNDDASSAGHAIVADNQNVHELVNEVTDGATTDGVANVTEYPGSNNQSLFREASPSLSEPSLKRAKVRKNFAPSPQECIDEYVTTIWKMLFANSRTAGRLDIKFGEWERVSSGRRIYHALYPSLGPKEENMLTRMIVRRAERDDQRDRCTLKMEPETREYQSIYFS